MHWINVGERDEQPNESDENWPAVWATDWPEADEDLNLGNANTEFEREILQQPNGSLYPFGWMRFS